MGIAACDDVRVRIFYRDGRLEDRTCSAIHFSMTHGLVLDDSPNSYGVVEDAVVIPSVKLKRFEVILKETK